MAEALAAAAPDVAAVRAAAAAEAARLARGLASDWRTLAASGHLSAADQALCVFAEKLTRTPGACGAADVATLRAAGFGDVAIHDAAQVVGYFNYINRVADGLGVDLEPEMRDLRRSGGPGS